MIIIVKKYFILFIDFKKMIIITKDIQQKNKLYFIYTNNKNYSKKKKT